MNWFPRERLHEEERLVPAISCQKKDAEIQKNKRNRTKTKASSIFFVNMNRGIDKDLNSPFIKKVDTGQAPSI